MIGLSLEAKTGNASPKRLHREPVCPSVLRISSSRDYGRIGHERTGLISRENRSLIEAEPINMHLTDPEFQAFDDQLFRDRVITVNRVTAAGVIRIVLLVPRHQVVELDCLRNITGATRDN